MSNPHKEHRKRTIDEFRKNGFENYPPHKVLEIMLFYSVPQKDTNPIAHALLERFGSLSGVFDAPSELLVEVPGVKDYTATFIKMMAQLTTRYMDDLSYPNPDIVINDFESAKTFMKYKFLGSQNERIMLACLGQDGRVINFECIAEGSPEMVSTSPGIIARCALRLHCPKVVVAHNHPYGFCNPSSKDKRATESFYHELKHVGVNLLDHVIVGTDGVLSMGEHGMIPEDGYMGLL